MLRSKKMGTQHTINDDAFYATCCDSFVLKIYLDHKFQWPQEGLSCKSLAYKVVTRPVGHNP